MITLGQPKTDNINRLIQLTDVFVYCLELKGPAISDYNKRLIRDPIMRRELYLQRLIFLSQFIFAAM